MAVGDDALAAGMDLVIGSSVMAADIDVEINRTRDYVAQRTSAVTPIANGGTGATTAAGARTALSVPSKAENDAKLTRTTAQYNADFASRDSAIASKLPITGGTVSGNLGVTGGFYVGTRPGASYSYVVAYFNGDNQLCSGVSSSRFKQNITRDAPIPDMFQVPLSSFAMRADPEKVLRYGHIAEDIDKVEDLRSFVVYDDEGRPQSYDMIGFLLASVEQVHRENLELRSRIEGLEADRG